MHACEFFILKQVRSWLYAWKKHTLNINYLKFREKNYCTFLNQHQLKQSNPVENNHYFTVLLESKLTLETQTSRLDPGVWMLETFEDRVWSLEDRVSRIEKQGVLENAKTQKIFEETIYFSKVEYL